MKRYNITAEVIPGDDTWAESARIKIDAADNGEWVRYEDALDMTGATSMSIEKDPDKMSERELRCEVKDLRHDLIRINEIIFAAGAALGTDNYFAIRKITARYQREARL